MNYLSLDWGKVKGLAELILLFNSFRTDEAEQKSRQLSHYYKILLNICFKYYIGIIITGVVMNIHELPQVYEWVILMVLVEESLQHDVRRQ